MFYIATILSILNIFLFFFLLRKLIGKNIYAKIIEETAIDIRNLIREMNSATERNVDIIEDRIKLLNNAYDGLKQLDQQGKRNPVSQKLVDVEDFRDNHEYEGLPKQIKENHQPNELKQESNDQDFANETDDPTFAYSEYKLNKQPKRKPLKADSLVLSKEYQARECGDDDDQSPNTINTRENIPINSSNNGKPKVNLTQEKEIKESEAIDHDIIWDRDEIMEDSKTSDKTIASDCEESQAVLNDSISSTNIPKVRLKIKSRN